jgi:IclR family acetate operon transcriptional repressor
MKPPLEGSVKSVKRCLDLLELLASAPAPLSFLELMTALEIPRSSLFHLMRHLIARGYVQQVGGEKRYALGTMPGILASKTEAGTWIDSIVRPLIRRLADETNEFCAFYVSAGDAARGVVTEHGTHALSYSIPPNHLGPLHAFSAGKVILASYSEKALDEFLDRMPLTNFTPNTITDGATLRRTIEEVRKTGLAVSRSEYATGVAGFAVAVRHADTLAGVINVSVPEPRLTEDQGRTIVQSLRKIAVEMENRLGIAKIKLHALDDEHDM